MKWYFPSWNGDVRVEAIESQPQRSRVTVVSPTSAEMLALKKLEALFVEKGWLAKDVTLWKEGTAFRQKNMTQTTELEAPIAKVAPVLVKALKSGEDTLTAVVLKDGRIETVTGVDQVDLAAAAEKAEKEAKAAASVKRPTPCCPNCYVDAVGPATEVLLDFLTPEQHEDWAKYRAFISLGSITGARYLISHRNGVFAARFGKICRDIDDQVTVHFHDNTVPPEEEALAAKLILEHQEPWLRNEATFFGPGDRFKNPFGDGADGTWSSGLTRQLGQFFAGFHFGVLGRQPRAIPTP